MNRRLWYGVIGVLMVLAGHWAWAGNLSVADAWIREAPPSARALAAYMVITNVGEGSVRLRGATCRDFETVELHRSVMHGPMMRMMAVDSLDIAHGGTAVLEPGGYHLMLITPRRILRAGDQVELRLHFDGAKEVTIMAVVKGSVQGVSPGGH
jgi:hypothetical protein